ncbi:MAG TPA: hypothetical protein VJ898_01025 [Natrialbaceae archaeon]|nr:hypothetical protein [Natrialbaceae archaeon]
MHDLKRMVTGIGLMVLATYLSVFGGVWAILSESAWAFGLWVVSPFVALPGFYYFVTVSPHSDGSDAETKP